MLSGGRISSNFTKFKCCNMRVINMAENIVILGLKEDIKALAHEKIMFALLFINGGNSIDIVIYPIYFIGKA